MRAYHTTWRAIVAAGTLALASCGPTPRDDVPRVDDSHVRARARERPLSTIERPAEPEAPRTAATAVTESTTSAPPAPELPAEPETPVEPEATTEPSEALALDDEDAAWRAYLHEVLDPARLEPLKPALPYRSPVESRELAGMSWLDWQFSSYDIWVAGAIDTFPHRPIWRAERRVRQAAEKRGLLEVDREVEQRKVPEAPAEAQPFFLDLLDDEDGHVRSVALFALVRVASQDAEPGRLEACLEDSEPLVRSAAADALGHIEAVEAAVKLEARLDDEPFVRLNAARSLFRLGVSSKKSIGVLAGLLFEQNAELRAAASGVLARMGRKARDAVPALRAALDDPERRVRHNAALALEKIDPQLKESDPAIRQAVEEAVDEALPYTR